MNLEQPSERIVAKIQSAPARLGQLRVVGFGGALLVLLLGFVGPLLRLGTLAIKKDLHSHVFLIPLIAGYLLYIGKERLPRNYRTGWIGGGVLLLCGLTALVWGTRLSAENSGAGLTVQIFALVCLVNAGGFLFLGTDWMRAAMFPMVFLLFTMPLPDSAVHWLEHSLKSASADAAESMFNLAGLPHLREGMVFQIPGLVIEVADECSGIRSSYVLFITSILASYLFLQSAWRRTALALFVIPLGVIRNAFRIFVIAWLCVEISPEMIHSWVHHRGGPLFFVLSLVPLLGLLWWLRRGEGKTRSSTGSQGDQVPSGSPKRVG